MEPTISGVGALDKSMALVEVVAAADAPCTLADLVAGTGYAKATVHRLAVARETLADIDHYETQMKASMKRLRSAVAASSQVGKFDEHTWGISVSAISVVPSPAGGQGRLEQRQITLPYRSRSPNPN